MLTTRDQGLNNLFSLYQEIGKEHRESRLYESPDFNIIQTKNSVWPNMAYGLEGTKIGHELIASIGTGMKELGMRPVILSEYLPDLTSLLKKNSFFPVEQWVGMYRNANVPVNRAENQGDVEIRQVTRQDEIKAWTEVLSDSLFDGKHLEDEIFISLQEGASELIGIWMNNNLVGTSLIHWDDSDSGGIYMVAIRKDYRRKGLAKSIVNYCLSRLEEKKCKICYLQATKMGLDLYNSLGFVEYSKYMISCKIK